MVRKDLYESGQLRSIPDLKGRRVSFNVEGSPSTTRCAWPFSAPA